jgi:hypothetical protein
MTYTSPAFDGSGNVTAAGTLATVNSNVGSFTNASVTVDAKGRITAASSGAAAGGITEYVNATTSGTTSVFTLTETYKHIECMLIGVSSSSSATISVDITDDGTNYGTPLVINQAGAGNYAGLVKISGTGVAATTKRLFSSCSLNGTSFASGSLGFSASAQETTETGITTKVRFSISGGTFDAGEIVLIGYK